MAIYHCSIKNIGRSDGRSAVACSAYRAAQKLRDKETGILHDFTKKTEVIYSEIFLCKNAPAEYADRETLWNEVQKIEKNKNARLAREWELALPNELTVEQSKKLVFHLHQAQLSSVHLCLIYKSSFLSVPISHFLLSVL